MAWPSLMRRKSRRYIAYESELEQLRQLRKRARGIVGKKTLADYALVRRCHFVFERASRKFAGDRCLWTRWLAFCRDSETPRQTSRVRPQLDVSSNCIAHPVAAGEVPIARRGQIVSPTTLPDPSGMPGHLQNAVVC